MWSSLYYESDIWFTVVNERRRQDKLKADGKFAWTCADKTIHNDVKLKVLAEEFGEVARALCESDTDNLRTELVQVAAVAVAWLEALGEK